MFKVQNNLVPRYMQTFTPVSVVHDQNTRSAARGDFYVSSANLKYYTRHFQYEGTRFMEQYQWINPTVHKYTCF